MKTTDIINLKSRVNECISLLDESNCPPINTGMKKDDIERASQSVVDCYNQLVGVVRYIEKYC